MKPIKFTELRKKLLKAGFYEAGQTGRQPREVRKISVEWSDYDDRSKT